MSVFCFPTDLIRYVVRMTPPSVCIEWSHSEDAFTLQLVGHHSIYWRSNGESVVHGALPLLTPRLSTARTTPNLGVETVRSRVKFRESSGRENMADEIRDWRIDFVVYKVVRLLQVSRAIFTYCQEMFNGALIPRPWPYIRSSVAGNRASSLT